MREPVTKFQCIGRSGFVFTQVHNLNLGNISISNCGGRSVRFGASALINTFNVTLHNVFVKNSIQYGMIGFDMLGSSHLSDCSFVSNVSYPNQPGGNMLLLWSNYSDDTCKASNNYILLHINNSIFAYGKSSGHKASGLHIDYQQSCKTIIITLTNTTFIENLGGSIAIIIERGEQSHNIIIVFPTRESCSDEWISYR